MQIFETSATVEQQGQLRVAGVPFAPGTEVEVVVREKVTPAASKPPPSEEEGCVCLKDLFAGIKARNTESVGALRREELYVRKVLR